MKRAISVVICITIFAVIFVLALMKNADGRNSLFQSENTSETFAEIIVEDEPLPKLEKPRIIVKKKERQLKVFDGEKLVKTYRIGLGSSPVGDKEIEGDGKTPVGEFYIFTKNAKSKFYLSLGVSYPSIEDARRGLEQNLISKAEHDSIIEAIKNHQIPLQKTKLGGEIYIHGNGSATDWTLGCIALSDGDMKEIFDAIPVGAFIKIEP